MSLMFLYFPWYFPGGHPGCVLDIFLDISFDVFLDISQVVTLAVYIHFAVSLIGEQWLLRWACSVKIYRIQFYNRYLFISTVLCSDSDSTYNRYLFIYLLAPCSILIHPTQRSNPIQSNPIQSNPSNPIQSFVGPWDFQLQHPILFILCLNPWNKFHT